MKALIRVLLDIAIFGTILENVTVKIVSFSIKMLLSVNLMATVEGPDVCSPMKSKTCIFYQTTRNHPSLQLQEDHGHQ